MNCTKSWNCGTEQIIVGKMGILVGMRMCGRE
jgi:hypothetical protein